MLRTYNEMIALPTFEERFRYLQLNGQVGEDTFGYDRYLNQLFYRSSEWKHIRNEVIVRDNGCDLADPDRVIFGKVIIHHLNPLSKDDIEGSTGALLDPNNLVCVSHLTHEAIHYGDFDILAQDPIERAPNDTCPWKR